MDWIEITVRTNTAGADMVSELIMQHGAQGTAIEDRNDADIGGEGPLKWDILDASVVEAMSEDVLVRGYLPVDALSMERVAALRQSLSGLSEPAIGFDAGSLLLSLENVREEDWAESWKRYYKPFRVGDRLVVRPVWEAFDEKPGDLVISIDPGMAFGNGTHETTAMCLELLESLIKPGDSVLDIGTGSGILALASTKLGAGHALAIDLDSLAVRVAKENIERNGLSQRITVQEGDLLKGVSLLADVAVANIIADAIIFLAAAAKTHVKPGGAFVCSGIIRDRESDVLSALSTVGFAVERTLYRGEWVAIVARA